MEHGEEGIANSRETHNRTGASYVYEDPFAPCWPESPEEMRLTCDEIVDWDSFHHVWATSAGFPDFYGKNMNAWIDCMSDMRSLSGMSRFFLESGQVLVVYLRGSESFRKRHPAIFDALVDATTTVNMRYRETGNGAALALLFV